MTMSPNWIEKIYAGWLAKIIGIRLGAPVEGWTHEKIMDIFGEKNGYLVNYKRFAADDDSNGPLFFLRALSDCGKTAEEMTADDVAEALLNYAPYEHGFFWWGGYGCSTEHTAYLNLRAGIPAPRSGSIQQNGRAIAEQIGGQIFIDTWGLAAPGNPDLAAKMARKAASVTHGGEGVNGGIFVAVCISAAFTEQNLRKIIETGLSYIPGDSLYASVVREVIAFYEEYPDDWKKCFAYIKAHHGYDRYPGNCHIIPNIAVMILALLYGEGDFSGTLQICNRCGWDTDCNVGNVATIMGVRGGLDAIDAAWREPINDFLACSGVLGSLNLQDIPYGACYIAKQAWKIANEELPEHWKEIIENRIESCHFEFPGSTHAMEVRLDDREKQSCKLEYYLKNTDETACSGKRCLLVMAKPVNAGQRVCVFKRCYLGPEDFDDNRYDPAFSPVVYPGQTLHGSVRAVQEPCMARLYAKNARTGQMYFSELFPVDGDSWISLECQIPELKGVLLDEVGFAFEMLPQHEFQNDFRVYIDDFFADGTASYSIDFSNETTDTWSDVHREVSQFTRMKGHFYLQDGEAHLSCADFGEAYTGKYDWKNYSVVFECRPLTGEHHYVCTRVQGGVRSYCVGLENHTKLVIKKNTRQGLQELASVPFQWEDGTVYAIEVSVSGNSLRVQTEGISLEVSDDSRPYLEGGIGLAVREGSHMSCRSITVKGISV